MYAVLLLPLLIAHPYHVSLAELEFNAASGRWEVALRLHPGDLDAALSHDQRRRVILERETPAAARRIAIAYLNKHFRLLAGDPPQPSQLHWVGMQADPKFVWWYFELQPPPGAAPLRLENRVLMEIEPTQVNTVNLLGAPQVRSLQFSTLQRSHPLPVAQ